MSPTRLALALGLVLLAAPPAARAASEEAERSLAWLRGQLVPNAHVTVPDPNRRGLILSYAPGAGRPGPLHRKSFVYDAGLSATAFALAGDPAAAARLLQALGRVQRPDGSFWFAYNADDGWPAEDDHDMAVVRAGATAWAGHGFVAYLEAHAGDGGPRARRERALLLATARRIGDFLLGLQVAEPGAGRGLLRGGRGRVALAAAPDGRGVSEIYEDRPIRWVSTEHNISSFFFLGGLARLTGEPRYATAAQAIRDGLLGTLWQDDLGQFAQGVEESGRLDRTLALDCASWGALFLLAAGEPARAARAVETAERVYRVVDRGVAGHRPYHDKLVYEPAVGRVLLPEAPEARWRDLDVVWTEGSLGVALARLRLGDAARAREIVASVLRLREGDGIRLASRDVPFELAGRPSAAATAWHVLVELSLRAPAGPGLWSR
jgi:hypothetical protein